MRAAGEEGCGAAGRTTWTIIRVIMRPHNAQASSASKIIMRRRAWVQRLWCRCKRDAGEGDGRSIALV